MNLGPHAAFIWWAYGIALAVVLALVAWIALDYRLLRRQVSSLEGERITRRSVQSPNQAPKQTA
jgi:heme exporter protein D